MYTIGDTVTLTCTVIATVPDSRNTAYIRWTRNNMVITDTPIEISPTTVDDIHSINYTHPLTINTISLSDAGQYGCRASVHSTGIPNVIASDIVEHDGIVNVTCKYTTMSKPFIYRLNVTIETKKNKINKNHFTC